MMKPAKRRAYVARTPCKLDPQEHARLVGHVPHLLRWCEDRERKFLIGLQAQVKKQPGMVMTVTQASWLAQIVGRFTREMYGGTNDTHT